MINGHDAVHVFFVISGFYMAMILRRKYGISRQGLRDFALNRFQPLGSLSDRRAFGEAGGGLSGPDIRVETHHQGHRMIL